MLEDTALISAIAAALAKVLRPLVRLMLKHSFPYGAFEAVAKRVYAECAMEDFALPGKKSSVSRAAILTGLTRKDVNALLNEPWDALRTSEGTHFNRAAKVVSAWVREKQFCQDGVPRALAMEGPDSFSELVRRHGGDVPVRAVLDELERLGSVEVRDGGLVRLIQRAFVPSASTIAKIEILGDDTADLIETIAYNADQTQDLRFQRKVMHVGIPVEALPAFRAMSAKQSQKVLESMDEWLSKHDMSDVPESEWKPGTTARVGLGIHYFEEIKK